MTMSDTVVVRTTLQPDRDLEVSPTEAKDLFRQGLLVADEVPAPKAKAGQPAPNTETKQDK